MELTSVTLDRSPDRRGMVRITGEVSYESNGLGKERIWFEVPDKFEGALSTSGNPWVACLAPVAVALHESLTIHAPVDKTLLENLRELFAIWKCWYPNLNIPVLDAEVSPDQNGHREGKTAAFFSGGIDSFFTVLHHDQENPEMGSKLDDLLCIWGFDIPLSKPGAFERMRETLSIAADRVGKELVPLATNLRETRFAEAPWDALSHGSALASIALALERRYARVLIGSSAGYRRLYPWGSHPLTDPLFSTTRTRLIHYGGAYDRLQKTELVAQSDVAGAALHVCWKHGAETNCGACEKCFHTMITLDLLGARERFSTFPWEGWSPARMKGLYAAEAWGVEYLNRIVNMASQRGAHSAARAVRVAIRRSRFRNRFRAVAKFLRRQRFVWRYADTLERMVSRGTVVWR